MFGVTFIIICYIRYSYSWELVSYCIFYQPTRLIRRLPQTHILSVVIVARISSLIWRHALIAGVTLQYMRYHSVSIGKHMIWVDKILILLLSLETQFFPSAPVFVVIVSHLWYRMRLIGSSYYRFVRITSLIVATLLGLNVHSAFHSFGAISIAINAAAAVSDWWTTNHELR